MKQQAIFTTGVVFAGLAVAVGAFGAHALRPVLEEHARVETFELAVRYQFYHSFAILFAGIISSHFPSRHISRGVICFVVGIAIFSGSLYALSLTGARSLGAITPIGGLGFIAGWLFLLFAINTKRSP